MHEKSDYILYGKNSRNTYHIPQGTTIKKGVLFIIETFDY